MIRETAEGYQSEDNLKCPKCSAIVAVKHANFIPTIDWLDDPISLVKCSVCKKIFKVKTKRIQVYVSLKGN